MLSRCISTRLPGLRPNLTKTGLYKPQKFLEFDSYDTLPVYKYTQTFGRTVWRFAKQLVPCMASISLLLINLWPFNLEPLCMPVFLFGTLYGLFTSWSSLAFNTRTIHEVRLKRDGMFIEVGFLTYLG